MEQIKRIIALGFFDGVHRGHQTLLNRVTQLARTYDATPAAVTFDAHPEDVVVGVPQMPLISALTDRMYWMSHFGMKEVIVAHFDRAMMQMSWDDFITEYLIKAHGAIYLVAGHDFRFGHKGKGTPERLRAKCAALGIGCDIMPKVEEEGVTVSSTYIRTLLAKGEMERVNFFLGHPYTLTSCVEHGKKLGTLIGCPTVNLSFSTGVMPPAFGVYATKVWAEDICYLAVTNVGMRPTVDDGAGVNVEGFLLDFSGDLYGKMLRVEFYHHLRGEKRFGSLEELSTEIKRNVEETREYFAKRE